MAQDLAPIHAAIALHRSGQLAGAERIYLRILQDRPNDADALHFLGMLRMHQKRLPAAIELVRRSLKAAPRNEHAWNNLGNMLLAQREDVAAEEAYRNAARINPNLAQTWFNLGILLRRKRRPEEALASFRRVLDSDPRFSRAYEHLGLLLYRMGRSDYAADVYRKWLEVEPGNAVARHMVAANSGTDVPPRADDRYLTEVFDEFAAHFDSSLARIGYAAPQILAAALAEHIELAEGSLEVLDAGCGTGLCGVLLRSTAKRLVGVDLSAGMLAKARERGLYDELVEGELCAFMRSRAAAFDVVITADTLVYFGGIDEPMAAAGTALRPGGCLAFTLEALPEDAGEAYRIQVHGRYAHRADYVRASVAAAGLDLVQIEPVVLRQERGEDVRGHAVIARRPGDPPPQVGEHPPASTAAAMATSGS